MVPRPRRAPSILDQLRQAERIYRGTLSWLTGQPDADATQVQLARSEQARAAALIGAEKRWPGAWERRCDRLRNGLLTLPTFSLLEAA